MARLRNRWKTRESAIIQGIYNLNYGITGGSAGGELEVEAPYLQGLLSLFVDNFPVAAFREISLESHGRKNVVGGCINIATGSVSNGEKPYINIQGKRLALFLGCLGKAKAAKVALASVRNTTKTPADFALQLDDLKAVIQTMTEVMAVAQVAKFNNNAIPIVNIMANRTAKTVALQFFLFQVVYLRQHGGIVISLVARYQICLSEQCLTDDAHNEMVRTLVNQLFARASKRQDSSVNI